MQSPVNALPPASPGISAVRRERGLGVLDTLRQMAIAYELKPGERLSEIELAARMGVSRTPVREALNRLVTEGFLLPCKRGVMRRRLDVQETLDLYEARIAIERECLRLAVGRASEAQIEEARAFLDTSRRLPRSASVQQMVELDEAFHLRIAAMAGNGELQRLLVNLNERIRFVRWLDMEKVGRDSTQSEHLGIVQALAARDAAAGEEQLGAHIGLRREQVVEAITRGLARIYLPKA